MLHVVGVVMTIVLAGKLDSSSEYSSEAIFLFMFLLAIALGLAGALCQAAVFSCKYMHCTYVTYITYSFLTSAFLLEDCGYTRTRGFTRPDPYPRVRVGACTCSTGTGWVG